MNTVQAIITVSVAVVGWAATYLLAMRHSRKTERRKSRIEFLMKTYKRIIELRVFAAQLNGEIIARSLCDITADIELQGTKRQTDLAAQAANELIRSGSLTALDMLAQDLLDDLRGNLRLTRVERQASVFGYNESHEA
ncbi:MAG TPA: hypothetical protein VE863_11895 [Pyrinomonadaceae bacterium]|jgi:hypothetical protein|nr:hypothetical protein [Pyrinomonadaceae bacterium]